MAAYNLFDEHHEEPFNLTFRVSMEGQDNFRKNFTENLEAIISRSLTSHAQIYFVPTRRSTIAAWCRARSIQSDPG